MKTFVLVAVSLFLVGSTVEAQTVIIKDDVHTKIEYYSRLYNVPEGLVDYVVRNESRYNPLALGDTHIICPKTGKTMRSRGLSQISDCYNDVDDKDAYNPDFALEFLAKGLANGQCSRWTTCRVFKSKYPLVFD